MSALSYMLDASALLALTLGETGAEAIHTVLPHVRISTDSLSEVVAKLQARGVSDEVIASGLSELDLGTVPFDWNQALAAGLLRSRTRVADLSPGDRTCLAAAAAAGAIALTTDRVWGGLSLGTAVEVAR